MSRQSDGVGVRASLRGTRRLRFEWLEPRQMLAAFDVLVFSKTAGFRHDSIDEGLAAIQALGAAHDFSVTNTEDAAFFTAANLAPFEAVVFLNTTGDVFDAAQETAFQNYIRAGGGYAGVHSAADTEHGWAWYDDLLGAHFASHPAIQQATIKVADHVHASTAHLPDRWIRTDEWYNYTVNPRGTEHVLMTLDESTYTGGAQGFDHPISWYKYFEGGRSWYTGLGHTAGTYSEPLFLGHLLGGIQFAAGQAPADRGGTIDANWQKVTLSTGLSNPVSLSVAPSGEVYFVELDGHVKIYHPMTGLTTVAASLPVYAQGEDGLVAIALDPNFESNHWIYLYYSPAGPAEVNRLSRFTVNGSMLDLDSERVLLAIPTNRVLPDGHTGGSLAFGPDGLLYLSTGDDTVPFESNGYSPIDERPGRQVFDAQRGSSNTNDLRGKILRIRPEADGSYSIPAGNLFAADVTHRPEIYVMGNRNPYRISIDSETGWLYWGEVGPDANADSATRGPRGYDELNQARAAGNFGWPYFIADNKAYRDFDFATGTSGAPFNPAAPQNTSPNNTGAIGLPVAKPALIWYPYAASSEFPELGTGSRTVMAGPVYHFDPLLDSAIKLPEYFDDTLIMYEWSRSRFWEVKLDDSGNLLKINPLFAGIGFARPIDAELGPDGALYVLEWGTNYSGNNADAKLVRVEFVGNLPNLLGDYNRNTLVDTADYVTWRNTLANSVTPFSGADGDGDGVVEQDDYRVWRAHFGQTAPLPGATSGDTTLVVTPFENIDKSVDAAPAVRTLSSVGAKVDAAIAVAVAIFEAPSVPPHRVIRPSERTNIFQVYESAADGSLLQLAINHLSHSPRTNVSVMDNIQQAGRFADKSVGEGVSSEPVAVALADWPSEWVDTSFWLR